MIELLVKLAVFGFVTWLVVTYIPQLAPVKNVIVFFVVIVMVLYILSALGGDIPLPKFR